MPATKTSDRDPTRRDVAISEHLERGRACYERNEWNDAYEALTLADRLMPLEADDLDRLAWSAGLTARDEETFAAQERLYHARLDVGDDLAAAQAAFWLGFRLFAHGEAGRAGGWLSRSQRLAERRRRWPSRSPCQAPASPQKQSQHYCRENPERKGSRRMNSGLLWLAEATRAKGRN